MNQNGISNGSAKANSTSISFEDVLGASDRIRSFVHRTPVLTCAAISDRVGCNVFFKCENFQKTGAFKFRGAVNSVAQLSDTELARGVVTHSSGNHAGALALAARLFGAKAHIVMPSNSSEIKKSAVREYGGLITECEPTLTSRISEAARIENETGAILIPPFDHPHVIAGQGTSALELIEQVPELDMIVSPIGGGGLMSGTCLAARALKPVLRIVGAEPVGADDAFQSKKAGKFIPQLSPDTVADGLRTSLGQLTWPFIRDEVDEILLADDLATIAAMKFFWERTKVMIEPSCAVPLAAIINHFSKSGRKDSFGGNPQNIGIIISGGNVDLQKLPWLEQR
jgi:threonine dehydratase